MSKILVTVVVALLLGQTTGALSFFSEMGCEQQCAAEQAGTSCLPGCSECACCGMARVLLTVSLRGEPTAFTVERILSDTIDAVVAPEPTDIFHIPKRLLA